MASEQNGHDGEKNSQDAEKPHDENTEFSVIKRHVNEARIMTACEKGDLDELRAIAIAPGGFHSDHLRNQAWPILLGSEGPETISNGHSKGTDSWRDLPKHRDEEQVQLDVNRSFVYYPNDNTQAQLEAKKSELSDLITQVLREQPYLCYFQGYHDISQVLLLALPPSMRAVAMSRLSVLRIRDFMLPTLLPAISQLHLIPDLLRAIDSELFTHLSTNEPFFALADTLTMFAHNVQRYSDIARLFDALMAREQVFGLYVFTQIVLLRRDELLAHDEPDMLHFALSKLPSNLDLDAVIADAATLFAKYPPESLRAWKRISKFSVLKTTRDLQTLPAQSLADGKAFFEKQVREMWWDEQRQKAMKVAWNNRRVLFTILVGVGAIYLRKSPVWAGVVSRISAFKPGD
ncbi:rab-GTPase-TBC domain-containing protein [Astrocystis sublimbata]|nr:rab-GTPase-TBC domain-containing protein [Astrocystis sublimbata]